MDRLISEKEILENAFEVNTKEYGCIEVIGVDAIKAIPNKTGGMVNDDMKLGIKIALQGVKEKINNITEEMARKGIDTKYFNPLKVFIEDRLTECEINEEG